MKRILLRAYHLIQRIIKESKNFPLIFKSFGFKVAWATFCDGIIPPGKSRKYISVIESFMDNYMDPIVKKYEKLCLESDIPKFSQDDVIPIWCCWWQGEDNMPEIVKMCNQRLKQIIPQNAQLNIITLDNINEYVELPEHILQKYESGLISMTALSDILRVMLLNKYGGMWIDATVFFSEEFPNEFLTHSFYTHKVHGYPNLWKREPSQGLWCGFLMAGAKGNLIFKYLEEAFIQWWSDYDSVIDYVILDYFLLTAYKKIPYFKEQIDAVPDNSVYIFEMYKHLNEHFSDKLLSKLKYGSNIHKLTYKMNLTKFTENNEESLYGYLVEHVSNNEKI